jgi:hypothetical protein
MTVAVCSIMRNSMGYMDRYLAQMRRLRELVDIRVSVGYGDASDGTADALENTPPDKIENLLEVNHGGADFGSVDTSLRWTQIASVVRPVLRMALEQEPEALVWVEADLVWEAPALAQLIEQAKTGRSVAPLALEYNSPRFYDHWGYRMEGTHFTEEPPYYPHEPTVVDGLVKIDSCGSCFATSEYAPLQAWDGRWPYTGGGGLWLDPKVSVRHP